MVAGLICKLVQGGLVFRRFVGSGLAFLWEHPVEAGKSDDLR